MLLIVLCSTKLFICSMKSIQYTHHTVVLVEPEKLIMITHAYKLVKWFYFKW